jgi:hypothetical protein
VSWGSPPHITQRGDRLQQTCFRSSILGEDVKIAADKAAAEMAKIMEKTEGK